MGKLLNLPMSLANSLESLILHLMFLISFIYPLTFTVYLDLILAQKTISQLSFMILPMNSVRQNQVKQAKNLFVLELCMLTVQSTNSYWTTTRKNQDMGKFICRQNRQTPKYWEQSEWLSKSIQCHVLAYLWLCRRHHTCKGGKAQRDTICVIIVSFRVPECSSSWFLIN